ncbi:hypothetical protein IW492_02670 [Enterococcus sp. BWB1-3]|uniref:hypothetical protein n=1 Tax=Enterococcus sp. BWB1-3 TaxID=2787713 RepID=UPI0019206A74|nr:hypothetical protein [Enterococcus sp. BWB1-3]MBL1228135.1 hypothetical protein [Enterococcus sp. BWB1-3]
MTEKYKVLRPFNDSKNGGHNYKKDDVYPAGNGKPDKDRVKELLSPSKNRSSFIRKATEGD